MTGYILALVCAVLYACIGVTSRGLKDVPTFVVCFWHTCGGLIGSFILISFEVFVLGKDFRFQNYTSRQYLIAAIGACFDSGAMLSGTLAY